MTSRMSRVGRTMFKTVALATMLAAVTATAVSAQPAISEPAAFQAQYPYRDVLNDGAPTPAAKLVLEPPEVLQALQARESGIGIIHLPRRGSHHRGR